VTIFAKPLTYYTVLGLAKFVGPNIISAYAQPRWKCRTVFILRVVCV